MTTTDAQGNLHDGSGKFAEKANSAPAGTLAPAPEIPEGRVVRSNGEGLERRTAYELGEDQFVVGDEAIEDLIDNAGYGVGYWAQAARVDLAARTYEIDTTDEADGGKTHKVGFDQIALTALRIARNDPDSLGDRSADDILHGELGHADSNAADVIIQQAIYGETRFG